MKTIPAFLFACLFAPACGSGHAVSHTSTSHTTTHLEGVETKITGGGLTVTVDESVRYSLELRSESGAETVRETRLNGMLFELDGLHLRLGDETFDGLAEGDEVEITADGIFVNGDRRWDLPAE